MLCNASGQRRPEEDQSILVKTSTRYAARFLASIEEPFTILPFIQLIPLGVGGSPYLKRDFIKVESVTFIIVSAHGLRVVVHHDSPSPHLKGR